MQVRVDDLTNGWHTGRPQTIELSNISEGEKNLERALRYATAEPSFLATELTSTEVRGWDLTGLCSPSPSFFCNRTELKDALQH
jgi:hypothetical protein